MVQSDFRPPLSRRLLFYIFLFARSTGKLSERVAKSDASDLVRYGHPDVSQRAGGGKSDVRPPIARRLFLFMHFPFADPAGKYFVRIVRPDASDFGQNGHFGLDPTSG